MKTAEQNAHEALTRVTAALDWMRKAEAAAGVTHVAWTAGLNNARREMTEAHRALRACWGDCDDCGDTLWLDLLTFNPDAGSPDIRTGGYTGKVQCQGCYRKWENREPGDRYHEGLPEAVAERQERERRNMRDAGRIR